ncbi:aminobutyraldehyde dehydrogenase [Mycolicibacterium sp.]|uniref:aminobutyraldehyde dehydrogenase n=1 Tax=Mycolicibacterium sp. TaxID=2320850 RepID=UPI003D11F9DD
MTAAISPSETLPEAVAAIARIPRAHFINGRFVISGSGRSPLVDPATGEPLDDVPNGTSATVDLAVQAAREAQRDWSRRTPADRAEVLNALADRIDAHAATFTAVEAINVGKPLSVAEVEVPLASDCLRFQAGSARAAQAPAAGQYVDGQLSFIKREPVGVVGAVAPWNYPLMMAVWKIAPAIAAGNTLVLKPSELTPLTTLLLMELSADIVPPGVVNVVLGTGTIVGEALSRHHGIDMVSLTGSVRSGRQVAAGAATTLKRVHLELGGKAPFVVFPDADVDAAVAALTVAGYWNTGQECGAAARVLCHESTVDEVVARLVARSEAIVVGGPADGADVEMGPLVSAAQRDRVAAAVDRARADGAAIQTGGVFLDRPGFFYAPTVVTDVRAGTAMAREEVFGPVISVETFRTESEAIAKANDVIYGLAASVWTADAGRAIRCIDQLDFGTVWVNSHLTLASEMPWGGFGASGYGRDNSTYALDDYTRTKHAMLAMGAEPR